MGPRERSASGVWGRSPQIKIPAVVWFVDHPQVSAKAGDGDRNSRRSNPLESTRVVETLWSARNFSGIGGHMTDPRILVGQDAVASGDVPGSPGIKSRATYIAHRTYGTPRQPEAPASGSARG